MATATGTVQGIEGRWARVVTSRGGACGNCTHKHHCHLVAGTDRMLVKARNTAHAEVGDEVELYLNTKNKLRGMFTLYIPPLVGLLLGAFSGRGLSALLGLPETAGMVIFTFSGLALGFLLARKAVIAMAKRGQLTPVISRVRSRRSGHVPFPVFVQPKKDRRRPELPSGDPPEAGR